MRVTWGAQVTQQPPGIRYAESRSGIIRPVSGRLQLCHLAVREISAAPLATNQVLQAAILSCVPASQLRGPVKHWSQSISPPWNGVPTASLRPQQSRGYHPFFLVSRLLAQPCHCSVGYIPGTTAWQSSRRWVGRTHCYSSHAVVTQDPAYFHMSRAISLAFTHTDSTHRPCSNIHLKGACVVIPSGAQPEEESRKQYHPVPLLTQLPL